LLKISGDVKLTIRSDAQGTRFELTASGSIFVFKIGDIASGAADFVLNIGSGLSNISFYGVAAIATNFDFLAQYGIHLSGQALLEINTTSSQQDVSSSLAGIPGDAIFSTSANYATLLGELPTDTFNKVALSADWLALFNQAGPGSTHTLTLNNGRTVNFGDWAATNLQNAQVEGVNPGQEWKI